MTHEIKILPQYFEDVITGKKGFEVRKNDRNYKVNDIVILKEYYRGKFTGREETRKITYMLTDKIAGIETGFCVFGISQL